MITASPLPRQPSSWQQDFASAITDPAELAAILDLPATWVPGARRAAEVFSWSAIAQKTKALYESLAR